MHTRKSLYGPLSGVLLLTFICCTAGASIINYENRSTWQAAAGGGVADIVDNLNSGTKSGDTIDRGSYAIQGNALNAFPNGNATTEIDGSGYVRSLMGSGSDHYHKFTFDSPIVALGFDINAHASSVGATNLSILIDGVLESSYSLADADSTKFRGFISTVGFTTFEVRNNSVSAWHGVDNVEAFAVPEPAAIALIGLFGGGIWGVHRIFLS